MAFSTQQSGEYKLPKLRKAVASTALCVLSMVGLGNVLLFLDETTDIWTKIGGIIAIVIVGLIWVGLSYAFLINNGKCAKCRILKNDYRYCSSCDLEKETELRNTTNPLHCLIPDCDVKIESVDAYQEHYLQNHESEPIAEGIFRPRFSEIRVTDALYIKDNADVNKE